MHQLSKAANVPRCVRDMYDAYWDRSKTPSEAEFVQLLAPLSSQYERTSTVMDALDESTKVDQLAEILGAILRELKGSVSILLTSRKYRVIETAFESLPAHIVPMDSAAINADIRLYISEKLTSDARLRMRSPEVKREIEKTLAEKAQGMYVGVVLAPVCAATCKWAILTTK